MIDPRTPGCGGLDHRCHRAHGAAAQQAGGNRVQIVDHQDEDTRQQAVGRNLGAAHQGRADGESLPPDAAADREPARRGPRHVRRAGAHDRRAGRGTAAGGIHGRRRTQRSDEEHRPLDHRRVDVVLRQPQGASSCSCACRRTRCATSRCCNGWRISSRPRASIPTASCSRSASRSPPNISPTPPNWPPRLRKAGFLFALEHFGTGRDPARLLAHLPVNYVKIDGTLMQGLAVDQSAAADACANSSIRPKAKSVSTIAERVEDANTMAVLWQLGIEFIQGYFVQRAGAGGDGLRRGQLASWRKRSAGQNRDFRMLLDFALWPADRLASRRSWPAYPSTSSRSTFRQPRGSTAPRCARSPR